MQQRSASLQINLLWISLRFKKTTWVDLILLRHAHAAVGLGGNSGAAGSVAVGVGLVGPVDLDANVGGLLVCQCRQLGAELAKVQPRHLLVQNLRRSSTI